MPDAYKHMSIIKMKRGGGGGDPEIKRAVIVCSQASCRICTSLIFAGTNVHYRLHSNSREFAQIGMDLRVLRTRTSYEAIYMLLTVYNVRP
jgi:hypothetical protein